MHLFSQLFFDWICGLLILVLKINIHGKRLIPIRSIGDKGSLSGSLHEGASVKLARGRNIGTWW